MDKKDKADFKNNSSKIILLTSIFLFLLAFTARMFFLFVIADPDNPGAGWFGDAYHHWQIAYLTREVGLGHGFLRLWDLKGMEFFWGLLHPVFTMIAFVLTGSVNIGVERAMTGFFGSVSVVLVYLTCKKYWNNEVAIAAAVLAALNPVGVFNDVSGMVEPIGIAFLLLGIYLFPKKPIWAGASMALALMARAEYWVFSLGLVFAMVFLFKKKVKFDNRMLTAVGFGIPLVAYMKYLLDYTGNPIYPFYYNYLTNIFGTWQYKTVLTPSDIFAKYLFLGIFILTAVLSILVLIKKPKGMLIYLLGLGNWMFLGATFGLGQYIKSYANYVWYVRFMILPYIFVGIVVSLILFHWIPRSKLKFISRFRLNWLILIGILAVSQITWTLIMDKYRPTEVTWQASKKIADEIASQYHGGGMVFIEGNPEFTYALVRYHGVKGKNIVSEMFDPYYYFNGDIYSNWKDNRHIVVDWLKENNIKTIVTYTQYDKYQKLAQFESKYISGPYSVSGSNILVYQVNEKLYE